LPHQGYGNWSARIPAGLRGLGGIEGDGRKEWGMIGVCTVYKLCRYNKLLPPLLLGEYVSIQIDNLNAICNSTCTICELTRKKDSTLKGNTHA